MMRSLPFSLLSLAVATLAPYFAAASSHTRNPISAISTVQNATIHSNSHRISAFSEFDLTFILQHDLSIKLVLEPNHDILGDDAHISYLGAHGEITGRERINRHMEKVFKGVAWVQRWGLDQHNWQRVGWARVHVTRDGKFPLFEGAFSVDGDYHHIQTSYNYLRTKHNLDPMVERARDHDEYLVVWRNSDILSTAAPSEHQDLKRRLDDDVPGCYSDQLNFNLEPEHPVYKGIVQRSDSYLGSMDLSSLFRRQIDSTTGGNSGGINLVSTIGQTSGCPNTRKVALVGVATDCTYTADFNSTDTAKENVIAQMNTASGVWENTFNISLGLQNLIMSEASCPGTPSANAEWNQACSDSVNIQDRLNMFSAWRGAQADSNSHWTLLSTCNTGSAVGLAWLGQACVSTAYTANSSVTGNGATGDNGEETVSGANVVVRTPGALEWQIIAHETGHTYGAVHDCTDTTCADSNFVNSQQCCPLSATQCDAQGQYIMNPSARDGLTDFSLCTIGNICTAIGRNSVNTSCLSDNKGVTTVSGQECGNGIVEPGEQCDCGGEAGCADDPCCDGSTCMYRDGAVCDDSNDDCCRNCQLASNGTVCRESTGVCDPQEVCSGSDATCPADVISANGDKCGDGLQCASGQCTSRNQQCKTVMGTYSQGNDTSSCDSSGCTISCKSPEFGYGVCYGLQQNFLDGTTCGGGGHCENGQCKGTSVGGQVKAWIDDHKAVVIGVCSAVGVLLLFAFLGCLGRCFKRRKYGRKQKVPSPPPGGWQGWNDGTGSRGARPQMEQQNWQPQHPSQGWAQQAQVGGWHPPPPPPSYSGGGRSVRYA